MHRNRAQPEGNAENRKNRKYGYYDSGNTFYSSILHRGGVYSAVTYVRVDLI